MPAFHALSLFYPQSNWANDADNNLASKMQSIPLINMRKSKIRKCKKKAKQNHVPYTNCILLCAARVANNASGAMNERAEGGRAYGGWPLWRIVNN